MIWQGAQSEGVHVRKNKELPESTPPIVQITEDRMYFCHFLRLRYFTDTTGIIHILHNGKLPGGSR